MWFLLVYDDHVWSIVENSPFKSEANARRRMAEVAIPDGPCFCLAQGRQINSLTTRPTWVIEYPSEEKK